MAQHLDLGRKIHLEEGIFLILLMFASGSKCTHPTHACPMLSMLQAIVPQSESVLLCRQKWSNSTFEECDGLAQLPNAFL